MSNVTALHTISEFEEFMKEPGSIKVVRFWATWCRPCLALEPIYNEAAKDMEGKASFAESDIDVNPALANTFGIRSVPTVIVFKNGAPAEGIVGLNQKGKYIDVINKLS